MPGSRLMTIKQKLTWLTVLVSALVLTLAALLFTLYEGVSLHLEASRNLATLSHLLASGAVKPLAMKDMLAAQAVLNQAAGSQRVVTAYLFDSTDKALAHYIREAVTTRQMSAIRDMQLFELEARQINQGTEAHHELNWFEDGYISRYVPVVHEGKYLGALYLRGDLGVFSSRLLLLLLLMLLVLGGSIALAYLLANHFQKRLAESVTSMAVHVKAVLGDNDWQELSAEPVTTEFKTLFDGFNELMAALSERDARLGRHQLFLEEEVRKRTRELQTTNTELVRAKATAEKANEAKSLFLANVSHEIRTPMVGVLGMAELLCNSSLDDHHRELADTVYRSARSLMSLLEDLLDFSKIEAGKLTLAKKTFNLRNVAEEVMTLMAPRAFNKGLNFNFVMLPTVPELLEGDPGRIRQMLLNLVGNAIKFTDEGHVEVRIWHQPGPGDGLFHLDVDDSGIGIAPHAQQKIFESFQQVDDSEVKRFGGTGLGLAIVRELSTLMGGDVQVVSVPGQGSRFTLRLPLRVLEESGFDPGVRLHLAEEHLLVAIGTEKSRRGFRDVAAALGMHARHVSSPTDLVTQLKGLAAQNITAHLLCDREFLDGLPEIFDERGLRSVILVQQLSAASYEEPWHKRVPLQHVSLPLQLRELVAALLNVPVAKAAGSAPRGDARRSSVDSPEDNLASPHILVVEDNPDSQKLIDILLSSCGYRVTLAGNGEEAVQAISNGSFDLALMDCQMPVLDGFAATRRIRSEGVTIPIIALTAFGRNEEFQRCIDAGMDDYLTKPFRQRSLFDVLKKWGV